jgi:hypothetical protein
MRMSMRRYTRLTRRVQQEIRKPLPRTGVLAFYNFCRVHKTLGATPAMASGLVDRVLKMTDVIALIDAREVPTLRGPIKKREVIDRPEDARHPQRIGTK